MKAVSAREVQVRAKWKSWSKAHPPFMSKRDVRREAKRRRLGMIQVPLVPPSPGASGWLREAVKEAARREEEANTPENIMQRLISEYAPSAELEVKPPANDGTRRLFAELMLAEGKLDVAARAGLSGVEDPPGRLRIQDEEWRLWGIGLEARVRLILSAESDEASRELRWIFEKAIALFRKRAVPRRSVALNGMVFEPLQRTALRLGEHVPTFVLNEMSLAIDRAQKPKAVSPITGDGLANVERRIKVEWYRRRWEEKFGEPAPKDLFRGGTKVLKEKYMYYPGVWRDLAKEPLAERFLDWRDGIDFFRDVENLHRAELGVPPLGEGWVNETALAKIVKDLFPDLRVQREAGVPFLKGQRFDIWIPALSLAIEYHGEQHFAPVEHFGGEDGLRERKRRDAAKRRKCAANGVHLIEWPCTDKVSVTAVRKRLREAGFDPRTSLRMKTDEKAVEHNGDTSDMVEGPAQPEREE